MHVCMTFMHTNRCKISASHFTLTSDFFEAVHVYRNDAEYANLNVYTKLLIFYSDFFLVFNSATL